MRDHLQGSIYQFLVLRNLLTFEPHVELVLHELHLKLLVRHSLVVEEHALSPKQFWYVFAPAKLQSHTQQVFLLKGFFRKIC